MWRRLPSNLEDEGRNVSWVGVAERVGGEPGHIPVDVTDPREGDQLLDPSLGWDVGPSVFGQVRLEITPEGVRVSVGLGFSGQCWSSCVCAILELCGLQGTDIRGVVRYWRSPGVGRRKRCWIGRVGGAPGNDDSRLSDA